MQQVREREEPEATPSWRRDLGYRSALSDFVLVNPLIEGGAFVSFTSHTLKEHPPGELMSFWDEDWRLDGRGDDQRKGKSERRQIPGTCLPHGKVL